MPTFAGRYLKEPADFATVASEAKLILAFCDSRQVSARSFADLSADDLALIQSVANPLILAAERAIESYAEIAGYALPLYPVDADVVDLASQWAWIGALQRGDTLSIETANKERQALRDGALTDIAKGRLLLTALRADAPPAQGASIYSISDAASRDTTGKVERMSRGLLGRR